MPKTKGEGAAFPLFPLLQYHLVDSMNNFINSLAHLNRLKLLLLIVVISLIAEMALAEILFFIEPEFQASLADLSNEMLDQRRSTIAILLIVIIGPYLETLVFQYLLLLSIRKLTEWITNSDSWVPSLFITSLIFSFLHSLNIGLNYHGFLNAALLTVSAFSLTLLAVIEFTKNNGHPIIFVSILHGFYNLIWLLPFILR